MKKLVLTMFSGPWLPHMDKYMERWEMLKAYGYDTLFINDETLIASLVKEGLGVDISTVAGRWKTAGYGPAYGVIFQKYLVGYEFWGWADMDVVFGRLDHFLPDEYLVDCDLFSTGDGRKEVNGSFTLFRNTPKMNNYFKNITNWWELIASEQRHSWAEHSFQEMIIIDADKGLISAKLPLGLLACDCSRGSTPWHAHGPQLQLLPDGTLMDTHQNKEILYYHFNGKRQWPSCI